MLLVFFGQYKKIYIYIYIYQPIIKEQIQLCQYIELLSLQRAAAHKELNFKSLTSGKLVIEAYRRRGRRGTCPVWNLYFYSFLFSSFNCAGKGWKKQKNIIRLGEKYGSAFAHYAQIVFNLSGLDENRLWHICWRVEKVELFTAMSHLLQK